MARKFTFKGKTIEELRTTTLEEFAGLLKARARRALKRANPNYRKLLKRVKEAKNALAEKKDEVVKTHYRNAVILPDWLGLKFGVHNGKEFKVIQIREEMIGRRLGEFAFTTSRVAHSGPGVGATRGSKFIPLK